MTAEPHASPTASVLVAQTSAHHAHAACAKLASHLLGMSAGPLTHACPSCGSSTHGQPKFASNPNIHVSLSRSSDQQLAVVAVSTAAPIGIDIEPAHAATLANIADVAMHPAETCTSDEELTRLWVRKEALLKAQGTGLTTDPRSIHIAPDGTVVAGPDGQIIDLEIGPNYQAALAVHTRTNVSVRIIVLEAAPHDLRAQ